MVCRKRIGRQDLPCWWSRVGDHLPVESVHHHQRNLIVREVHKAISSNGTIEFVLYHLKLIYHCKIIWAPDCISRIKGVNCVDANVTSKLWSINDISVEAVNQDIYAKYKIFTKQKCVVWISQLDYIVFIQFLNSINSIKIDPPPNSTEVRKWITR